MERIVRNEAEMEALGRELAEGLAPGAVLGLVGGLGAGKTRLAKGLVAGLGHSGEVTSPTFALLHEYRGGRLPVFHFDFYRLESESALIGIGWDEILEQDGVVIAEWADLFPELLPDGTAWLRLEVVEPEVRRVTEGRA